MLVFAATGSAEGCRDIGALGRIVVVELAIVVDLNRPPSLSSSSSSPKRPPFPNKLLLEAGFGGSGAEGSDALVDVVIDAIGLEDNDVNEEEEEEEDDCFSS